MYLQHKNYSAPWSKAINFKLISALLYSAQLCLVRMSIVCNYVLDGHDGILMTHPVLSGTKMECAIILLLVLLLEYDTNYSIVSEV